MSSFTYNELLAALQSWPQNAGSQYVAAIPRIIGLGEVRVIKDLNLTIFDKITESISTTNNVRSVTKPADCIAIRSISTRISNVLAPVYRRSLDWCRNWAPNVATTAGVIEFYAELDDNEIYLVPTPNGAIVLQIHYIARPTPLSNANQNTWIATNCGDLLFAACLMEAEHYLKADDRYEDFKRKYYEEILPVTRMEIRNLIRDGDYNPFKPAAKPAE